MKHAWVLVAILLISGIAYGDETPAQDEKIRELEQKVQRLQQELDSIKSQSANPELEEIRRELNILAEEVEKLRSGSETETEIADAKRQSLGLGPSAAKIYSKKQGVSIAGYGEMLYENSSGNASDQIDFLRAVVYVGYRFNDKFLFNSELEVEHASTGEGSEQLGEVSEEFAYIDYLLNDSIGLRGGLLLVPMGLINEFHEPNVFLGAHRPFTETRIIPSTWTENGFGVAGRAGMLDYRAYLLTGLNAAGFSAEGLEESRQHGSNAKIHPAFVARADVTPVPGVMFGGSIYTGESGFFPGEDIERVGDPSFRTVIGELHGQYRANGWDLRALYAHSSIDNALRLNQLLGLEGADAIGKSMAGGYLQAGYDVLSRRSKNVSLIPYARFEKLNTQSEVPPGFLKNPANDFSVWTFGAELKPIPNIVIKADYQNSDEAADQFNIAMGYSF